MDQHRLDSSKVYLASHGLSITIFGLLFEALGDQSQFLQNTVVQYTGLPILWYLAVGILSMIGYSAIYGFVHHVVYRGIIFRIKYSKLRIKGTWYYVHIPTEKNKETGEYLRCKSAKEVRAGTASVTQDLFNLNFEAKNISVTYDENEKTKLHWAKTATRSTRWSYRCASFYETTENGIKEVKIYACYTAISDSDPRDAEGNIIADARRLGIHDLTIEDKNVIRGRYLDTFPSTKRGEILFFRNAADRDAEILDFFRYTGAASKTDAAV